MQSPSIVGWIDPYGQVYEGSESLSIEEDEVGEWAVLISLTDSAGVRVDIGIQEEF
jgi:hypothetical protein